MLSINLPRFRNGNEVIRIVKGAVKNMKQKVIRKINVAKNVKLAIKMIFLFRHFYRHKYGIMSQKYRGDNK